MSDWWTNLFADPEEIGGFEGAVPMIVRLVAEHLVPDEIFPIWVPTGRIADFAAALAVALDALLELELSARPPRVLLKMEHPQVVKAFDTLIGSGVFDGPPIPSPLDKVERVERLLQQMAGRHSAKLDAASGFAEFFVAIARQHLAIVFDEHRGEPATNGNLAVIMDLVRWRTAKALRVKNSDLVVTFERGNRVSPRELAVRFRYGPIIKVPPQSPEARALRQLPGVSITAPIDVDITVAF